MKPRDRLNQLLVTTAMNAMHGWERATTGVAYSLGSRAFMEDPHAVYRALREKSPVHRSRMLSGWVFTRYDDVLTLFRDTRLSADGRNQARWERIKKGQLKAGRTEEELSRPTMLTSDPPRHTRLRGLVSKAFTPRAVSGLAVRMEQIVDEMLDATTGQGEFDVVDAIAYPLPVIIIAEMLGVPAEDRDRFRHWSDEVVRGLGLVTQEDLRASINASRELSAYFEPIAEERRREPQGDLLSGLLAAEAAGDRLTLEEVFQTALLLLVAGNETTTKVIANGLYALLTNPDQFELLAGDPGLVDTAVEELLRWDGPVHATGRAATEDFEFQGAQIRKGQMVMLGMAGANRDPARFTDPETLDITRVDNPHLSFGQGLHFCLGSSLARLEARTVLLGLIRRYPKMKLATEKPEWGPNAVLRGLAKLPIRV
jgi:pimeloyl-[acyl-carrier protein] synthase